MPKMERKWVAEDGTEHDSRQAAEAHDAKVKLYNWLVTNVSFDFTPAQREHLADELTENGTELIGLLKPFVPPQKRKRRAKFEAAA